MTTLLKLCSHFGVKSTTLCGMITNDVSDYINLLVRIAHIICNHPWRLCLIHDLLLCGTYMVGGNMRHQLSGSVRN